MDTPYWQATEDYHTAGEPFRIVSTFPPSHLLPNTPVASQRNHILSTPNHPLDTLRQVLCHEPRGHADMYGCFITPPDDAGAHFGVLFWHRDGFSTACGHGTIALGYWALERGWVGMPEGGEGRVDVVIDVPSGRVVARASCKGGRVEFVDFVNVGSYLVERGRRVDVTTHNGERKLTVDLAFGGAVYACVDARELGWEVEGRYHQRFVSLQKKIKEKLAGYLYQGVYDIYGVCFYQDLGEDETTIRQRNVVVFADGQIDRSPCGSGTAARVAALLAEGRMNSSKKLIHSSILDTVFEASILSTAESPTEFPACIPQIRGKANLVGRMSFFIDPADPLHPGFLLR